eukprot:TRINITY_DN9940_c0_g1_i2.p1 TRINITY_DN9940_c0_g1~~TRINITY_DN9940_c0_g1_i2.p1  ORF type:complete len:162 (-),score=24.70 TRINITY_DN9940_c0_g1_i2:69-554(-)
MPHSFGYRARTRKVYTRDPKRRGYIPSLSTYLAVYKVGDYVDVVVNPAEQRGLPYKYYQGRTGRVWSVTPRAVGVLINKRVRQRIMRKKVMIRVEHVRKSQCNADFLARVKHNEEVRKTGKGTPIKRVPTQPRGAMNVKVGKNAVVPLGSKKYNFAELFDY